MHPIVKTVPAVGLLFACRPIDRLETPPVPPGANSVVLTIAPKATGADDRAFASTIVADATPPFSPPLPAFRYEGEVDLFAAFFSATVDALGLSPGEQRLGTTEEARVQTSTVYAMSIGGARPSAWMKSTPAAAEPILLRVPFKAPPATDACASRGFRSIAAEPLAISDLVFAVAVDARSFLYRTTGGLFLATVTSTRVATRRLSVPAAGAIAGFHSDKDNVYLVEPQGRIWEASASQVANDLWTLKDVHFQSKLPAGAIALDGSDQGGAVELWAATDTGVIETYAHDMGWFGKYGPVKPLASRGIAWIQDGTSVAVGLAAGPRDTVTILLDDLPRIVTLDEPWPLASVAFVDPVGVLYGGSGGVAIDPTKIANEISTITLSMNEDVRGFVVGRGSAIYAYSAARISFLSPGIPCEAHRFLANAISLFTLTDETVDATPTFVAIEDGANGWSVEILAECAGAGC
jgi:hypothetical protein